MKAFLALLWQEIRNRRALLVAAGVASLFPVLAPLLPATGGNPAADVREFVMWIMVGSLVPIFALLLGVSFIGRDLSEGRLGFYFSQPMSGWAIWFGKLAAVVLLVWAAQAIMMLPTFLLAPDKWQLFAFVVPPEVFGRDDFLARYAATIFGQHVNFIVWLVPAAIVLVGHAVGIVWRDRSAWLVLDFIALTAIVTVSWWALNPFLPFVAPVAGGAGLVWLAAWLLVGLIAAGACQLAFGRVDSRRGHRSLSAALWCVLGIGVVALGSWSGWVRSATPDELERAERVSVASGEWIAVSGSSKGRLDYRTRFIVNAVDGRWVRAGADPQWYWYGSNVTFSGNGLHVFWTELTSSLGRRLMSLDLSGTELEPDWLGIEFKERDPHFVLSHDGGRIATVEDKTVAVYDVESGDQLAATVIGGEFTPQSCWFDGRDGLTIEASTEWEWEHEGDDFRAWWRSTTYRFDIASKTLTQGEVVDEQHPTLEQEGDQAPAPPGSRHLQQVEDEDREWLGLVDAESGEIVASLSEIDFLWEHPDSRGGRIYLLRKFGGESATESYDADSVATARIEVKEDGRLALGGYVRSDRFTLGTREWESIEPEVVSYGTIIVDVVTGEVTSSIDGLYPLQALGNWGFLNDVSPGAWQPGSVSSRLLRGEDDSLHLLDPETSLARQVIPPVL